MVSSVFEIPLIYSVPTSTELAPTPRLGAPLSFVGGNENGIIPTVLEQLITDPLPEFNPLTLCGASGMGKSLLARCFASHWLAAENDRTPGKHLRKINFVTGDDWARGYVQAVRDDQIERWRSQMRDTAFFVIDDVGQMLRQPNARRELTLLIDDLMAESIPIVATVSVDPRECEGMDAALASRLCGGLVVNLQAPDGETRERILDQIMDRLVRDSGLRLTAQARDWFADNSTGSVSAMQQALMGSLAPRLPAFKQSAAGKHNAQNNDESASDESLEIDLAELKRLHRDWSQRSRVSIKAISKAVSRYTQVPLKDMIGPSRRHLIVQARSLAMYLAKQLSGESLRSIGQFFANRDHTTVMHACQKIENTKSKNPTLSVAVDELTQILTANEGSV